MTKRQRSSIEGWVVVTMTALLVLYPLSAGPAVWLCVNLPQRYVLPALDVSCAVYAPLDWVFAHSRMTDEAWNRYIDFWDST